MRVFSEAANAMFCRSQRCYVLDYFSLLTTYELEYPTETVAKILDNLTSQNVDTRMVLSSIPQEDINVLSCRRR